ncbi:hypothetical protein SAMN02745227_00553 [Anaerobranca californiensis DSM 14826]|jgi:hypothetical protein|uniref:Uncharacterized protein n=1 Tax=Anaerobranca californiensis DSM 14826 TaxID=1120989 RepID=A0A1M6LL19_9FIRM|nr:hypothetical protein [Anaerobranca californiensis]SHJ71901.1 hypothetical protein SAMN02745227_00553 [Anaerobranca californiensis DSM 14826]
MSKLLKDLGLPWLLIKVLITNLHYLILLIILTRFFFAKNFPSLLDKSLLIYILLFFVVNKYIEIKKKEERKKFLLKINTKEKSKEMEDKVVNE